MTKKKRRILISISAIAVILIFVGAGSYIWYANSPFPTVRKLISAVQEKNVDDILACIEPETAQKIQLVMRFTGISEEDLLNRLMTEDDSADTAQTDDFSKTSVKFGGYQRDGNTATVSVIVVNAGGEENIKKICFKRVDGTWYLSLSLN